MEIILVGRSNVGKSSVIRRLTGERVLVGRRLGVTREISRYSHGELDFVDMPGFGYMAGISKDKQEAIKKEIVHYLETHRQDILFAIQVIDSRAFGEIIQRWEGRGQLPVDIEMFQFLKELELRPVVVANKIDIIYPDERDCVLNNICEKLGMSPPWRQWSDVLVPMSAKTGEGALELKKLVRQRLGELGHERLWRYLK
jgi:GTP-binding protein EngB required for normal cell division